MSRSTRIHPRPKTVLFCRVLVVLFLAAVLAPPSPVVLARSEPVAASDTRAESGWAEWFEGFFSDQDVQDEWDGSQGVVEKLASEPVVDIQLCPATLSLYLGEIHTLIPVGLDEKGKVVDEVEATFSSDNTAVADVTSWGEVEAFGAGTANITVTMETVSVQIAVSVATGFRAPIDDATADAERAALCPDSTPSGEIVPPDGETPEPRVQDVTLEENELGAPPNAAVESAAGSVSKAGGNYGSSSFSFAAPVLSLPGRESSVDLALIYNSQVWEKDTKSGSAKMNFNYDRGWPAAGWRLGYGRIIENFDGTLTGNGSGGSPVDSPGNALLIEADGTRTELIQSYTSGVWKHESIDGRLLRYNFANGKLKYPNGTIVTYELKNNRRLPTVIQSPNGNITRIAYKVHSATFNTRWAIDFIEDTLLRRVNFTYDNGVLVSITAPAYNGSATPRTLVELSYDQSFQLRHNFSIPRDDAPANNTAVTVLRRIYFPTTGTGYVFPDYSTYGIIRKVSQRIEMTSASDGTEVAYSFYNYPADNSGAALGGPPRYTQRQEWWQGLVNDSPEAGGNPNAPVTYGYGSSTAGTIKTHTITHPTNAKTGDKLVEVTTVDTAAGIFKGKHSTTTLRKNSASGTVMAKVEYGYSESGGGAQRSSIKWTNEAGQVSRRITTFDSSIPSYGRVNQVEEQDGSTTVRKTAYTYADAAESGGDYLNTNQNTGNFFHLVKSIRVFDPTNLVAKTEFEYDKYATNASDNGALPYEMQTYGTPAPLNTRNSTFDSVSSGIPGVTQRGHVTMVTRYQAVGGAGIARRSKYDVHGNAVRMQVGCCNLKKYAFASGSTGLHFSAVMTETEGPDGGPNLVTNYAYDLNTGVVRTVTDPRNHQVSYNYDAVLRLTSTSEQSQDGATATTTTTSYAYNIDPVTGSAVTGDQLSFREQVTYRDNGVTKTQESMRWLDGAGHVIRSGQRAISEGNVFDAAQVTYDIFGRPLAQSNPYRSTSVDGTGTPVGWTVNTYDVLSRAYLVTLQDGQTVLTEFAGGRTVSVTDQVGRRRAGTVDALGRTTQVLEDTKTGGASWRTDYVYDKIDNLLTVKMYVPGSTTSFQSRSAQYDALGRMTQRTTPEGGSETFSYVVDNEMSLLDIHTDARGATTDYGYDGLNRVNSIQYTAPAGVTDPPNVTIGYSTSGTDNGEITSVNSGAASSETYGYDSLGLGRVTNRTVTIDSRPYPLSYTYNGLGQAATMTYPSGRQVRTGFDPRGRLSSVAKINAATATYLSGTTFNAAQQITGYTLGNGVVETFSYSETLRQQLVGQTATKSGTKLVDLRYNYAATTAKGGGNRAGNSGQLMAMSGTVGGAAADQTFGYDGVGRLLTATGLGYGQGSNATTIGTYATATSGFLLKNTNAGGNADLLFSFGAASPTVRPLSGDYDGNGTDTIGVYESSTGAFHLKNSNAGGGADLSFIYGPGGATYVPLVGDWNGDGIDTVGIYNTTDGGFLLRNSNSEGGADLVFSYGGGGAGLVPLVGDWDGDGIDTIGVYHVATGGFLLRNSNSGGGADLTFNYGGGGAGLAPLVGDWNGDGTDTIGVYHVATGGFLLRNSNSGGVADLMFNYGAGGASYLPITGNWDGVSTPGGTGFARKYEYDRWGNRTKLWTNVAGTGSPRQTVTIAGGTIPTNRITSVADGGTQNYTHDAAGNITSDGQAFGYDAVSRIVSVDGAAATYGYDVANQRTKRTTGGATTHYIWDGSQVIGEYNGATGGALVEYIYAGGKIIARDAAGVVSYYHGDRLTTRVLTNTSGVAVWSGSHDPYGEDVAGSGITNKHRFTSYERDSESGTDYAVNRQYSFGIGRFMRPDPVAGSMNNPQSHNRYTYTRGDPINLVDPLGLFCITRYYFNSAGESVTHLSCFLENGPSANPDTQGGGFRSGGPAGDSDQGTGYTGHQPLGPPARMSCDDLIRLINEIGNELAIRKTELEQDSHHLQWKNGFKSNPHPRFGSVEGHQEQFDGKQRRLRDAIKNYDEKCKKGPRIPRSAREMAFAPTPSPRYQADPSVPTRFELRLYDDQVAYENNGYTAIGGGALLLVGVLGAATAGVGVVGAGVLALP